MFEQQLARVPAQPPRTLESLPGLNIFSVIPKTILLLPLLLGLVFLVIPLSIMKSDPLLRLRWERSNEVQGTVVTATEGSCRNLTARRLMYTFTAPGRGEFRGTALVCQGSLYYAVQPGDALQLRYLDSDPAVNVLRGAPDNAPPFILFLGMPVLLLVVFVSLYVSQVREILRARRLVRLGTVTEGSVLYIKRQLSMPRSGWQSGATYEIFVEYSAGGTRREAVGWCGNDWLVGQWTPGSNVRVAYLEEAPGRVAVLEAFLR